MDPTACFLEIIEAMTAGDFESARTSAAALREWLEKGGFYPPDYDRNEVDAYLRGVLRRTAVIQPRS